VSSDGLKPYNQIQAMLGRIRKQAGIAKCRVYHVLRHTFATRVSEKNIDLKTIQRWLGHTSVTTTMTYVHSMEEHLEAAGQKLD
jgi:integrase/recombinase XerD